MRAFNAASLISGVLLGCTVVLWASAFVISPWNHRLSITESFHVSVWGGFDEPFFGRLVFFNNKEYGPYRGSIISLSDSQGNSVPPITKRAWGDLFGVYYRYFHWSDTGETLWTLMVSLGYPLLLFSVLPAFWLWQRYGRLYRGKPA